MTSFSSLFRRTCLIAAASCMPIAPGHAEDIILRLAETATVLVPPDELAASLRAEAVAPTAQDAQRRVNEAMRDALVIARKATGITVSTGAYNVWRAGPTSSDRTERWAGRANPEPQR